jgi:hypothetical protein
MEGFHTKSERPSMIGRQYWIVKVITLPDAINGARNEYEDLGFAKWDGHKWNKDFDFWYGE